MISSPSSSHGPSDREIERMASRWIGRRDAGMSAKEAAEFERWRRADPRHEQAFSRHEATWRLFDRPAGAGQAGELVAALERSRARRRFRRHTTITASLACMVALGVFWRPESAVEPATSVAEAPVSRAVVVLPERATLPDGSVVEAKPGAEYVLAFDDSLRRVELKKGEALFHVAKDARKPFVVTAAGVEVRAVGTAFSVQLDRNDVGVLVTEGLVTVESPARSAMAPTATQNSNLPAGMGGSTPNVAAPASPPGSTNVPVHLAAGQHTLVTSASGTVPRVENLSPTQLASRLAWRSARLEFTATPLQEAIELFNCYATESGSPRLVIEPADPSLAQLEVSGYFRANNVAAFLHLISQTLGVNAETHDDRIALRRTR